MYQGFYELTSGILTQQRNLNTISNNMANVETAGFKKDTMTMSTFREEMVVRTGRTDRKTSTDLHTATPIVKADRTYTDFSQGALKETDGKYDFAISGNGFFAVRTPSGVRYTRNGSFSVLDGGVLRLENIGDVLGTDGQPIRIDNENFTADDYGRIRSSDGRLLGQIRIVGFPDTDALRKEDNGMYSGQGGRDLSGRTKVMNGYLEQSNADMVGQMTAMMSSERALQSAAQMLRLYDTVLQKASGDVGSLR